MSVILYVYLAAAKCIWKTELISSFSHGIRAPIQFSFFGFPPCSLALMATESNPATILNTNESHQTLISINVAAQAPLKLTSTIYLSWKLKFQTLFIGYDLLGYIDGSKPCPPATLTQANTTRSNPDYTLWSHCKKHLVRGQNKRVTARLVNTQFIQNK